MDSMCVSVCGCAEERGEESGVKVIFCLLFFVFKDR